MDFAGVKNGLAEKSFVLLDVRKPEEHKEGKIPGASNLPRELFTRTTFQHIYLMLLYFTVGDIEAALKLDAGAFKSEYKFDLPAKDAAVVTHCLKGGRAGKAVEALKAAGFTNVQVRSVLVGLIVSFIVGVAVWLVVAVVLFVVVFAVLVEVLLFVSIVVAAAVLVISSVKFFNM